MLAIGVERGKKSKRASDLARYFLNPEFLLPKDVYIYYWVYPHKKQILIRDASLIEHLGSGKDAISFMVIKYFPLAFMVTFKPVSEFNIRSLNPLLSSESEQERNISVDLGNIVPSNYPEDPSENGVILYGDAAMKALPVNKKL